MEDPVYINNFKTQFADKYEVNAESLLGAGAYASVYKGKDVDRNIDVAIKIYHDGITQEGSFRDWVISSVVNHHQIAHTYTIENFKVEGKDCKAVISRFVPGKSLQGVWDALGKLSDEEIALVETDYAHTLIPSLLTILSYCHQLGYGHGDLRQGNVMINLDSNSDVRLESVAYLIDFDNASIKDTLNYTTDEQKMASDYRGLRHIILGTLEGWEYRDAVEDLLDGYDSVLLLKLAYQKMLEFIKISEKGHLTLTSILLFLKSLIPLGIDRKAYEPIIKAAKRIAIKKDKGQEFTDALIDFDKYYQDYEDLAELDWDLEFVYDVESRRNIYKKIFGQ